MALQWPPSSIICCTLPIDLTPHKRCPSNPHHACHFTVTSRQCRQSQSSRSPKQGSVACSCIASRMSHAYSKSEQTQMSNPRPPPNAAFIQASSSSNLSGPYAPGTTLPSAIIISDDGLGSTSSISESQASSIPQRAASAKRKHEVITISDDSDGEDPTARFFKAARQDPIFMNGNVNRMEKRLDTYLKRPPFRFQDRLDRAMTQRMFLIGRERKWHEDGTHQIEEFDMAGTTGNVYKVTICKLPRCTCPDAMQRGKQCKHIIYVGR
jgi:hypothetical protein